MRNRKLFRTFIIVGVTAACLVFASALWADGAAPKASGSVQAEGVVIGMVKSTPDAGGKPALRISIQEDSGDILTVEACERISTKEGGPGFTLGDRVRVIGTMTQKDQVAILESCDIRILSALADSGGPGETYVPTSPIVNNYFDSGYTPYVSYPWTYTWFSPFVVFPEPFFRFHVFFGRDGFRHHHDGHFGFRGSHGTRFGHHTTWSRPSGTWNRPSGTWNRPRGTWNRSGVTQNRPSGTWHRSGGTWANPGRTGIRPQTITPPITGRRWNRPTGRQFTPTTPITPRIMSAPQWRGSFSGPRMHGSFSGPRMSGGGRGMMRSR